MSLTLDNVSNFGKVIVSQGYDNAATSIVLNGGMASRLPAAPFNITWWNNTDYPDPTDDPNVEIVRVTAIVGDTLTVTRAQEGTLATTKNTANKTYKMSLAITAKMIADILSNINTRAAAGANSDITSLASLSTPLSVGQGGTGSNTAGGARANLGVQDTHQNFVVGENINASTTPQAVYLKASDGKVYRLNSTTQGEAAQNFVGFIDGAQNLTTGQTASVLTADRAIVSGFTGLTIGAYYFSTDSAGVISTTPGTYPVLVGQAVTATTLMIVKKADYIAVVPSTLGNYVNGNPSTTTDQVTCGFHPRIIKLTYYLQGYMGGNGFMSRKGIALYLFTTLISDTVIYANPASVGHLMSSDNGYPVDTQSLINTVNGTSAPTAGSTGNNNGMQLTLDLSAVDDSSFTIRITVALSPGFISPGNSRCQIFAEAWK